MSGASSRDDSVAQRVYATVDSIPSGRVATYGQVASEAGLSRRARLVGRLLAGLPPRSGLPWHRVVNAAGRVSDRPGAGPRTQRRLLRAEGVRFDARGRIDLELYGWKTD